MGRKLPPLPLVTRPDDNNNNTEDHSGKASASKMKKKVKREYEPGQGTYPPDFEDSSFLRFKPRGKTGFLRILAKKTKKR